MNIHLLSADVAGKIAAGEVVERPANVAKELIENSLDAGATEIRVEIREGGQRLLRVIDDGHGIPADEISLALHRHATSKLHTADDLNRIATFGFRGEALYSIAAVSHLTLASRHNEAQAGVQIRAEGGQVVAEGAAGMPVGTIVTVEHIFFNTPARKKFLRRTATEAGHISSIVQRYALAWPERRFSLINEGRLLFQSTGSGDVTDVLAKIYTLDTARQMVGIGKSRRLEATDGAVGTGGLGTGEVDFRGGEGKKERRVEGVSGIQVSGFVSLPVLTRGNRGGIDLFINRRYVEDRSLTHAVIQAYHTLLPVGRFPIGVIFVELDPSAVDVNVHPRKTEVRFQEAREVFSAVQRAVRRVVVENASVPGFSVGTDANEDNGDGWAGPGESAGGGLPSGWAERRGSILSAGQTQRAMDLYVPRDVTPRPDVQPADTFPGDSAAQPAPVPPPFPTPRERTTLPPLRVVGQVGALYIVAEGPEGMFLIDQHAAHERVMYEKFMAQRLAPGGGIPRQGLLNPLTLHLGDALAGQVTLFMRELAAVGFDVEPFGGDTWLVRSVPSVLAGQDAGRMLEEIVQGLALERDMVGEQLEAELVKMVCKRASIKAGQILSDLEMKELIRQLEECQSPRTCPHGRPTMIQLSSGELEKAFKRT
ncbi:MAG: DNA mismatch repair endonuclease MutL [Caldilineaceae bacterium]|nr:DNA mismatch repair endonuclease MutL [Caldilineaceae bacterium]